MRSFREFRQGRRLGFVLLSVAFVAVLVTATVPALRLSVLRSAGRALVVDDPPAKVDIIIIATDALGAGVLEADDLFKAGLATRVAVFDHPLTRTDREFTRRGVQPPDLTASSIQLLHSLGVTDILEIPAVEGTEDEGKVLRAWCVANSIHSIAFVSTPDHSRRTRRVLQRDLVRNGVRVVVKYSRYSPFDPQSWWQTRSGQRTELQESQKLLLDFLRHPLS
jgi:hypothetical protein